MGKDHFTNTHENCFQNSEHDLLRSYIHATSTVLSKACFSYSVRRRRRRVFAAVTDAIRIRSLTMA